jgi:hypothetical protein
MERLPPFSHNYKKKGSRRYRKTGDLLVLAVVTENWKLRQK